MSLKRCPGYTGTGYSQGPHDLEEGVTNFSPGKNMCRDDYRAYAADWRAARRGVAPSTTPRSYSRQQVNKTPLVLPDFRSPALERAKAAAAEVEASGEELVSDEEMDLSSHAYRPIPGLIELWTAVTKSAEDGADPINLMFLGPSGCGKTVGARFLASLVGLPFTKVDAAAMTDPESWFGTREVTVQDGVSVTTYRPSSFVQAIERPGVLLIDEMNRVKDEHRNVTLPLLDDTHRVTNPLTGDVVIRDPYCFVIMTGNRGLQFTGTYAIDPALMTRAAVVEFDYADEASEMLIAQEATGCDEETARLFVRFATESRSRAKTDPDFAPISTREVMKACQLVSKGLSTDLAATYVILNGASPEGGPQSIRQSLANIWAGIRNPAVVPEACDSHYPYDTTVKCILIKGHADEHYDGGRTTWY